jgi:hypothetical protein
MLPGEAGINVRKTARYAGKDCDPLQCKSSAIEIARLTPSPETLNGSEAEEA